VGLDPEARYWSSFAWLEGRSVSLGYGAGTAGGLKLGQAVPDQSSVMSLYLLNDLTDNGLPELLLTRNTLQGKVSHGK
jgi:hypothetical protein